MPSIPQIQIRQQYAKLGIEAGRGQQQLQQPRPGMEIETTPTRMEVTSRGPELRIDQSRAWDALGRGGNLEVMSRIYSQARQVAMEGIARIAQNGDRMAAIHQSFDVIADIAQEQAFRPLPDMNVVGYASFDNVDIHYTAHKPDIQWTDGQVDIRARVNPPIHQYERGKLDIYMIQYGKVDIIPPMLDVLV